MTLGEFWEDASGNVPFIVRDAKTDSFIIGGEKQYIKEYGGFKLTRWTTGHTAAVGTSAAVFAWVEVEHEN